MKKGKIKIIFLLILLAFISLINRNEVNAAEVVRGSCGASATWSLDDSGLLTISGSGSMSSSNNTSPWADYQAQVRSVKFEGDITSIASFAFKENTNITEIILPDTITSIGQFAFWGCTNLRNVTFSKNLSSIGQTAFYRCTSLEEVDLPERLMYIRNYAFSECTSLKNIIIRSDLTLISEESNPSLEVQIPTIPETTMLTAQKYTNAYYYARYNGRKFKDIKTGEITTKTFTKEDFLKALPTTNLTAQGVTAQHQRGLGDCKPEFCNDKQSTKALEIKAKVEEITANCTTDREKAEAIFDWVTDNMTYKLGIGAWANIDNIYRILFGMDDGSYQLIGNCESFTMLTNYMLYLVGIPVGTATDLTHEWSVAYIDGQWMYIDATGGNTAGRIYFGRTYGTTELITFAYDGFIYGIFDPTEGAKLIGIAKTEDEISKLTEITIPNNSYIKSISKNAFDKSGLGREKMDLRATMGMNAEQTIGEKFIRENRACCEVIGNQIIGRQYHENNNEATCTKCKTKTFFLGNVNGDSTIDTEDAVLILKDLAGNITLVEEQRQVADVNKDGIIDTEDAVLILKYLAGNITEF